VCVKSVVIESAIVIDRCELSIFAPVRTHSPFFDRLERLSPRMTKAGNVVGRSGLLIRTSRKLRVERWVER
jgi:hypothetical protein